MYLKRSTTMKYLIAAYAGAALYCEFFVYLIQPLHWPDMDCPNGDTSCFKILFIADPQIQGDYAAPPPINHLFSWDSDRYLKSTFSAAIHHFKPDVLVFLGDLMDEGSICTIPQFHGYVKRLSNIFNVNYPVTQIWLPGDNDIGGENEPVSKQKIAEFEKVFEQPSILTFKNVTFYKVNGITQNFLEKSETPIDSNFKIVLSHIPLTLRTVFGQQVNKAIRPNIYFCAHEHASKYIKQNKELAHRQTTILKYGDDVLEVNFTGDTIYEIYVPTCSYRMGTNKIGYGAAVLEHNNSNMRYTVLWSPRRFPYLFFYLALLVFLIIYFTVFCTARLFYKCSSILNRTPMGADKVPLLNKV